MSLAFLGYIVTAIYGLIFCLPIKIEIWKKYGFQTSYKQLVQLGNEGEEMVLKLRKRTKIMVAILIVGVLLDLIIRSF